jgi:hypothetical protein
VSPADKIEIDGCTGTADSFTYGATFSYGSGDYSNAIRNQMNSVTLASNKLAFKICDTSTTGMNTALVLNGSQNASFGGLTTHGATMAKGLQLPLATDPTDNVVDSFAFFGKDITAGNCGPAFRTENGTVIKLDQAIDTSAAPTFTGLTETASIILMHEVFG